MNIQWYPGHMTKTIRQMQDDIKLVDLVIELCDARIPRSSRNPEIDRLANQKSRVIILNKADLADENENRLWKKKLEINGVSAVLADSRKNSSKKTLLPVFEEACAKKLERLRKKGIVNRPIRAIVVGVPNVGKSTFINSFSGRATAKTGNKPGVTRGKQWIRLSGKVELLDTPGILWPKFEDPKVGESLALTGAIKDDLLDIEELASLLIENLKKMYPGCLEKRFGVSETKDEQKLLLDIAGKRGCLIAGGGFDLKKAAVILIDEFRSGNLGRITLERAEDTFYDG